MGLQCQARRLPLNQSTKGKFVQSLEFPWKKNRKIKTKWSRWRRTSQKMVHSSCFGDEPVRLTPTIQYKSIFASLLTRCITSLVFTRECKGRGIFS